MKTKFSVLFACLLVCGFLSAREYHVSINGKDSNPGTEKAPFRSISQAAQYAYPGDVITVHEGVYREWINPPRGGENDERRIVYRAAAGEKVEIKGSERVTSWQPVEGHKGVWKVEIPNDFFGEYNPYVDYITGDWFDGKGYQHHTGEVFLNNKSLYEKASLDQVYQPVVYQDSQDPEGSLYTWYCEHNVRLTTIWANFHHLNPNKEMVEISVRPTCFYPEKKGVNYITLSGFHISQAATQWAPPTAEQIGMVATHWNKGWIIENNVICNSKCNGITLGKERNSGHNVWLADPTIDGSLHYIEVTFNAIREGWNKENIGSHIVRNNVIYACEQTAICGSMGSSFSLVENNHIYDIWTKRQFQGAELAGIKFHAALDTKIAHNRIHHCGRGLWLDWMTQGTHISSNLIYDNDLEDLFLEVNHGPYLVENNILGSPVSVSEQSQGGAYVHNLFLGKIFSFVEHSRYTPYFLPHSTEVAGLSIIPGGDNRFYNNLFAPIQGEAYQKAHGFLGVAGYDKAVYPMFVDGNVYCSDAMPFAREEHYCVDADFQAEAQIVEDGDEVFLDISYPDCLSLQTGIINTALLGKAKLPKQSFESADGGPIVIDYDILGHKRTEKPVAGPLENIHEGKNRILIWRK